MFKEFIEKNKELTNRMGMLDKSQIQIKPLFVKTYCEFLDCLEQWIRLNYCDSEYKIIRTGTCLYVEIFNINCHCMNMTYYGVDYVYFDSATNYCSNEYIGYFYELKNRFDKLFDHGINEKN